MLVDKPNLEVDPTRISGNTIIREKFDQMSETNENLESISGGEHAESSIYWEEYVHLPSEFVSDSELKNLMLQYSPQAMKDISKIEKGVENFFLFHASPLALTKRHDMEVLRDADLKFLESKNVFTSFSYLIYHEEFKDLRRVDVLIRPASLKLEQAGKVIRTCILSSIQAVLVYLHFRDSYIRNTAKSGELSAWVQKRWKKTDENGRILDWSKKSDLPALMNQLKSLSVEALLQEKVEIQDSIEIPLLNILTKRPRDILENYLAILPPIPEAESALADRAEKSPLLRLHPEFHVFTPSFQELLELQDGHWEEHKSELEIIKDLFSEIGLRILRAMLPEEELTWIQTNYLSQSERILQELQKHPSFSQSPDWKGSADFLSAYEKLIQETEGLKEVRKETMIDFLMSENLKKLNMKFQLVPFNWESFEIHESVKESMDTDPKAIYKQVLQKIENNPDVLSLKRSQSQAETPETMLIWKDNVAKAFVQNKNIRNLLHSLAKKNGMNGGIYDFLIDVSLIPSNSHLVDDQIALSKAISQWEEEIEKERIRRERSQIPLLVRLIYWFLSLFGIEAKPSSSSSSNEFGSSNTVERNPDRNTSKKSSLGVIRGPKEKQFVLPAKVQKAVEFVERKYRGLIWVDEVISALASPDFTYDKVVDLLFFDNKRRFIEIKALNGTRRVFIRKEKDTDKKWLLETSDYLDNISSREPEYEILSNELRQRADSV